MKLSILIPTYNYDCTQLVESLQKQLPNDCEICVCDDASTNETTRDINRRLQQLVGVTYWELPKNVGRSKIRNILAQRSHGDYLLFIDSDAKVESSLFVQKYLTCLPTQKVVCGGIHTSPVLPSSNVSLRWNYERVCEKKFTVDYRNQSPYANLSTFNIMIPRPVAQEHPFDESITRYGYEDTLLGKELEMSHIDVIHIDNPLLHEGLEPNEIYLEKTERAMETLHEIASRIDDKSQLLIHYKFLQRLHLVKLTAFIFRLTSRLLYSNLTSEHPSIRLFQLYKLGYFCSL